MAVRTTILQLLMYWLLVQPSIQASLKPTDDSISRMRVPPKKVLHNICDFEERNSRIFCFCNSKELHNATEASCLLLNGNLSINSPEWDYLSETQNTLEVLTVNSQEHARMNYIPSNGLRSMKKLRKFTANYANLSEIPEHAFYDMNSIMEVNLDTCEVFTLNTKAFDSMNKLAIINLYNNSITEINRTVFVNLGSLTKLFLNRNKISVVHDSAFKDLIFLKELDLSENKISVITTDTFQGLKSLEILHLGNNQLDMLGDNTFMEMPELKILELDQNRIQLISEKALSGMRSLKKLILSENGLIKLAPDFLYGAPKINYLDLRGNKLKTMTFDNVKHIVQNLYNKTGALLLDDNELVCDCKLAWIWGLRNETMNEKLKDSLATLSCFLKSQNTSTERNELDDNITETTSESGGSDEVKGQDEGDEMTEDYGNDSDETPNSETGKLQKIDGNYGYIKNLSDLKLEELPCPEQSQDELMDSTRSSSRQENAPITTSSSAKVQIMLGSQLLFIAFTSLLI